MINNLAKVQVGFRKCHSSETQLTAVIYDLAKILDHQGQFEKAIDIPQMNSLNATCLATATELLVKIKTWINAFL